MTRGAAYIALENPKTPANVGSVLRAAGNFGVRMVAVTGKRMRPGRTDPQKHWRHGLPYVACLCAFDVIPYGAVPIAIELADGAKDLRKFHHPENAFYIFGPEDGSVRADTLKRCKDVVQIPSKHCLNLAGSVHVVLWDRILKGGVRHERNNSIPTDMAARMAANAIS